MPQVEITPDKPQDNMSHRKPTQNKSSSFTFNPLAKSMKGDRVLVQQENGSFKVLLPKECSKEQMLLFKSRPNFSPMDHKEKLMAAKYHQISQCVVIPYSAKMMLFVYYLDEEIQWLTNSLLRRSLLPRGVR
jgi:hypothetical protein